MFEDYLKDSKYFYEEAESHKGDEELAKRYYRASVFCAASALEAFINFIGNTIETAGTLEVNEVAYINDQVLEVVPSKGTTERKTKFNSIEGKLKFLIKRLDVDIVIDRDSNWSDFKEFKKLRDRLIHPKEEDDEVSIKDYSLELKKGLNSNIYLIDKVAKKLFSKGLRRSLTDLKIE